MRIVILGGRLQGTEAVYLCSKAGYETVLVDKDPNAPAKNLANEFHMIDIIKEVDAAERILKTSDAVLPACENMQTLALLENLCNKLGVPFMQDSAAYRITSDKTKTTSFFLKTGIPTPEAWPACGFPVIVKPSTKSGSEGVYRADNTHQLEKALEAVRIIDRKPVVQEFIEGPALSLEVISARGSARPLQVTALEFDERYGCKRVYAPAETSRESEDRMSELGTKIASELRLNGLTDIQALVKGSSPKVNEINARLPSQTPTVVYHSTGINMAELLVRLFLEDRLDVAEIRPKSAVLYQHVKAFRNELKVQGEHVMANALGLRLEENFFGAEEAITNLRHGTNATDGVATLIVKSHDIRGAVKKMEEVVRRIMREFALERYNDPSPRSGRIV